MDRFKQFITHLIIALGGVVFLTSTTCAEQFEDDPVEYEITVVNDSEETIYAILRIFRLPYADDGLGGWEYPQPPHHPEDSLWLTELASGESFRRSWTGWESDWSERVVLKLYIVSEDTFNHNSFDSIVENELYDYILTATGTEVEANDYTIVFNGIPANNPEES